MTEKTSGPAWLKIGGLLTGVAALLTAIATVISTFVDIWPDRDTNTNEPTTELRQPQPVPARTPPHAQTAVSTTAGTRVPGASETPQTADLPPAAAGTDTFHLVRYDGDGCFYAVDVLETDRANVRVRFPFGLAVFVPASAVQTAQSQPSALQRGASVLVPGARARPEARRTDFYAPAIINDILGSTVHVQLLRENACAVSREKVALPAAEVLLESR